MEVLIDSEEGYNYALKTHEYIIKRNYSPEFMDKLEDEKFMKWFLDYKESLGQAIKDYERKNKIRVPDQPQN